jgi:parvulin-like peptidyl-prolyl isomerase
MVMSVLREKIRIIILVTLAAFVGLIFFDWGMQGGGGGGGPSQPNVIAKVNGRDISYDAYRQTRMNTLALFEQRTGRTAEFADLDAIEDDTWLQLIQEAVLREEIAAHDIKVSDAEILAIMRTNPPDFVRAGFTDQDGQFDAVRYSQALADPAWAPQWAAVENEIRIALPVSKLQNFVSLNVRVTSSEVRDLFLAQNEKVKVDYVASLPSSVQLPDDAVSDDDLKDFYRDNEGDFQVGRQAVLELVKVSKAASAQDSADVRADLEDVRQMAVEGIDDFATIASRYSDDPSSERGGDLGLIARGDMPKALEDVAFATDVGAISEVFASPFGYHILKVEERTNEDGADRVRVRHVLMRVEPSNTTLRDASDRIGDFLDTVAEGGDFRASADELRLEVETTPPFERDSFIPGLGLLRAAHRFAFFSEIGDATTEPIEDANWLYAFRLVDMKDPRTRPFDEVQEALRVRVSEEKRRAVARENLENAIAAGDGSLAEIADALGGAVASTAEFSRESFVPGVGRRNQFVATAFSLPANTVSDLVDSDRGFYVIEVTEIIPADEADFVEQQDGLRQGILLRKRQAYFSAWLEEKVATAEVVDFRSGKGADWKPNESVLTYTASGDA